MKIVYLDEYGEPLYNTVSDILPNIDDLVFLTGVEWFVKERTFHPESNTVSVMVTETASVDRTRETKDGRLSEMKAAILDIRKRQDKQESKGRILREQLVSIRSFLRTKPKTP